MRHQGITHIIERLRSEGLEGDELRTAYLQAFDTAVQESSIFAHEGRHSIDQNVPH